MTLFTRPRESLKSREDATCDKSIGAGQRFFSVAGKRGWPDGSIMLRKRSDSRARSVDRRGRRQSLICHVSEHIRAVARVDRLAAASPTFWLLLACIGLILFESSAFAQPAPEGGESNSLVEVIVRDRRWPALLNRAGNSFASGNHLDAVKVLQECFAAPEDGFVMRPEWKLPAARANAARLLREAGEPAWQAYEKLYGITAQQCWSGRSRRSRCASSASAC